MGWWRAIGVWPLALVRLASVPILTRLWANTPFPHQIAAPSCRRPGAMPAVGVLDPDAPLSSPPR